MLSFKLKLLKYVEIWKYDILRKYFISDQYEYLVIKLSLVIKVKINLKIHKIYFHGDEYLTVIWIT